MLDIDLAKLYGVAIKRLSEVVKKIRSAFRRFMFQLTKHECDELITNCDCLKNLIYVLMYIQSNVYLSYMNNKQIQKQDSFSYRVKELRKRKGITQVELARKLKVTQRGISYYENETDNPSMEIIEKIAKALGVPKRFLIDFGDIPLKKKRKQYHHCKSV